jgi:hypothetical protein
MCTGSRSGSGDGARRGQSVQCLQPEHLAITSNISDYIRAKLFTRIRSHSRSEHCLASAEDVRIVRLQCCIKKIAPFSTGTTAGEAIGTATEKDVKLANFEWKDSGKVECTQQTKRKCDDHTKGMQQNLCTMAYARLCNALRNFDCFTSIQR